MTNEHRDLTAVCAAAHSGYVLRVIRDGSLQPLAEKELPGWPDWPAFPAEAAAAAGCELVLLGYMIWPDTVTPDSLIGWHPVPDARAWSAQVATFADLLAHGY
ncbi:hypothetical protein ABT390_34080 [Streptomyces aurantiacus]|uniref:Uncharacterized protein n=1 Tax=Streptomyces aurantiacus JA 4570 TaxID=1286094 RepID=S3ZEH8_9ACTN|nr:hypothetical protein [Streptomyces aurantiacus]EPH41039.1 hypothetical protein STRAU_5917 [Streptomyces aurantiacus JA 4570]